MSGPISDFGSNLFTWIGLILLPILYLYPNWYLLLDTNKLLVIASIILGVSTLFFLMLT